MARWILLALMLLGCVLVFTTHSAFVLGIGLLAAISGAVGFVLVLASDRIAANARPEVAMASPEDLKALRRPPGAAGGARMPPGPGPGTPPPA